MSRQLGKLWSWPFGILQEGYEFLAMVEYRFDPEYSVAPSLQGL